MRKLAACAPADSLKQVHDAANQLMMSLHALPASSRQVEDACASALSGIEESIAAMCPADATPTEDDREELTLQSGFILINSGPVF